LSSLRNLLTNAFLPGIAKHEDIALHEGFLGTAPLYVDLVLLLELAMGLGLLAGAIFARVRKFQVHAWCQTIIVLLNAAVITLVMLPSFRRSVSPRIPLKLGKSFYAMATAHAALGAIVEGAGLYILLAASTTLMPEKLRLTRYKLWMRAVLVAWWVVILLGVVTYARWYIPNLFRR
jgi:Ca2+/H+ antiporter